MKLPASPPRKNLRGEGKPRDAGDRRERVGERLRIILTSCWAAVGVAFAASLAAWPLSWLLDNSWRPVERVVRAIAAWPFLLVDDLDELFLVAALEGVFLPSALMLGFGALIALPLFMTTGGFALARGVWRGRAWAMRATLVAMAILAVGSAWFAVRPSAAFGWAFEGSSLAWQMGLRATNLLVAAAMGFAAWALRDAAIAKS